MPKHFGAFLCCLGVNHLDSINAIFKIEIAIMELFLLILKEIKKIMNFQIILTFRLKLGI